MEEAAKQQGGWLSEARTKQTMCFFHGDNHARDDVRGKGDGCTLVQWAVAGIRIGIHGGIRDAR